MAADHHRPDPLAAERRAHAEYLATPQWAALRSRVLARDGHACRRCRGTENLEVHHLRYDRHGHERLSDLITLCVPCHERVHALRKGSTSTVRATILALREMES